MIRNLFYVALLVLVIVVTMGVVRHYRIPGSMTVIESQAMDMSIMAAPVGTMPVSTARVEQETFAPTVTYTGSVRAWSDEDVVARVAGRVLKIAVYPGDRVVPGQLLVQLDSDELASRQAESAAATQTARAKTASAQASIRRSLSQISAARTDIDIATLDQRDARAEEHSARANLAYWNAELGRTQSLYKNDAVSLEELQKTRADTAKARTEYHHKLLDISKTRAKKAQMEQALLGQGAGLGQAQAEQAAAVAAQSQQERGQRTAEIMQSYAAITAQSTGSVTERLVSPGTLVMAGTVLLRLKQVDRLRLQVRVPASEAARIRAGSSVHYRVPDSGSAWQKATVTSVFREADPLTRTTTVEAIVKNSQLVPGDYIEMQLALGLPQEKLTVPLEAVLRDLENRLFVWLLQEQGASQHKHLWTCVMHPEIIRDKPGKCPKCGMRLVPKEAPARATPAAAPAPDYTCVMHPEVSSDKPGKCPKCGMDLVPREKKGPLVVHRLLISLKGRSQMRMAIAGKLTAGDEVVVAGASNLSEGMAVLARFRSPARSLPLTRNGLKYAWDEDVVKERTGFNISRWSVEHPHVIASVYLAFLLLAVLVLGYILPRRFMPYVESPLLGVVTMMPGLSAEEMETYISKPIEERMVNVAGVRYIRSTSQDGFSIVSLEFPYGSDMRAALASGQSLLNVIQADLPVTGANLKPSWVLPIDPLNLPVLSLSLSGDSRWSPADLRQLADNEIVNRLKSTSGDVLAVGAYGGYRRQLQVVVDRQKLSAYGLSILDVRDSLDRHNVARPAGTLTDAHSESIVRLNNLAHSSEEVLDYVLKADKDRVVYIKDVARIEDTFSERRSAFHSYASGKATPAIEVNLLQNPSASSPRVIAAVEQELKRLEHDYPGIHFEVAYDSSRFVSILTSNMFEELIVGVLLTGILVLLFLGDWRATLVSLITIPTSLAMAMLAMVPLGLTLNSSTLIGLLISIGRLVDDSVIDLHAIERHLRLGMTPREATIEGITEVRLAVAASTLMLILALSPLLFCGGIVELMFKGLVLPLILGLLSSFVVSLTLTAVLSDRLLVDQKTREGEEKGRLYRYLLGPCQRALDGLEIRYEVLIGWLLKHRFANLVRVLITVVIGCGFYYFIGSEMMPLADVGQGYLVLEMEPGTSFAATEQAVLGLEGILAKNPELRTAAIEIGTEPMSLPNFSGYAVGLTNGASAMLTFSDMAQRKRTLWQIIDSIQSEATRTIPGIRRLQIGEMGSDVMASSSAPVQILVYGPDMKILSELAEKVADLARREPGMHQVGTSWTMGSPDWEITVDPRRGAEAGVTPDEVAAQVYYSLHGGFTNEFYRLPNRRQVQILVRYDAGQRRPNPSDLNQLLVQTPKSGSVPLSTLATLKWRAAPTLIEHDSMRRVISVTGSYRQGGPYSMDLGMFVMMKSMSQLNWPPGYGIEMRGDMTQMMDSFARLLGGMELAILFIFLVLVAQFRGFLQPAQMVFSIPLELSGVFLALYLNHQAFSTVSILAIIVLTGMDATTAILLIDQILRFREKGMPRNVAIRKACPTRLRPILMTSMITLVVMVPVAFFPKTGMDAYSPLGTVIVGGLLIGTVLSLIDIPIMHSLVDDLQRWLQVRIGGRDPETLPPLE